MIPQGASLSILQSSVSSGERAVGTSLVRLGLYLAAGEKYGCPLLIG